MPLTITIPENELFDYPNQMFINIPQTTITLEHSLISISKWEAKWHKPFLTKDQKTNEEMLYYVQCMSTKGDIPRNVLLCLTEDNFRDIKAYIEDPMTATTIREDPNKRQATNFLTSELIYSWMIGFNVPVEFEKWHINRLMMLLRVLEENNKEPKKRSQADIIREYQRRNAANKAKFKSKG